MSFTKMIKRLWKVLINFRQFAVSLTRRLQRKQEEPKNTYVWRDGSSPVTTRFWSPGANSPQLRKVDSVEITLIRWVKKRSTAWEIIFVVMTSGNDWIGKKSFWRKSVDTGLDRKFMSQEREVKESQPNPYNIAYLEEEAETKGKIVGTGTGVAPNP